jgi:pimeloyl-ACP methyl ester carboxylesterase
MVDTELVAIPGAGHVSNLERPGQFNEVVCKFCRARRSTS